MIHTHLPRCLSLLLLCPFAAAQQSIDLAGDWRLRLDRADEGVAQGWFRSPLPGDDHVALPGDLAERGFGDPVTATTQWTGSIRDPHWQQDPSYAPFAVRDGHFRFPFWLQPERRYAGAAWYQREIDVPAGWLDRRAVLVLERPHGETRVWLDGRFVAANDSLSTPHEYDLGIVAPGRHRLTIRADNRSVDVGSNSHSVSDHTQGNWNGIVGAIDLHSTPQTWIDDLQVFPDAAARRVHVRAVIGSLQAGAGQGTLALEITAAGDARRVAARVFPVAWRDRRGECAVDLELGAEAALWDEFSPALHRARAVLDGDHAREVTFGLRTIATDGTTFLVNGRPTFFRGTLECAIFPATGHPPCDVESWRRIVRRCQEHGLNHVRFHSWCPPAAAFVAADELGFYCQVECASWANGSTSLGDGRPVDGFVDAESARILRAYGNHPSFVLMAYGNEPGGRNHRAWLQGWVERQRARDGRRLYTSGAGWPELPVDQFHVIPEPRIQQWGQGLASRINAKPPATTADYREVVAARKVPVISHEIGQWCAYPDLDAVTKYTGYLKARSFELFRDSLRAQHLDDLRRTFLLASGALQTLCYKEEIEAQLRTPGLGGFQLLDLHDFPGQGTALVGVLDPFWDGKGYVTPAQFRRFCGPTVPLARLARRVFTSGGELEATLEVAHFGKEGLTGAVAHWRLVDEGGAVHREARLPPVDVPLGSGRALGALRCSLAGLPVPARYRLTVDLEGTGCANDWDLWVYPDAPPAAPPPALLVTRDLDAATAALANGAPVLWLVPRHRVAGDRLGRIALGFSPIFWNTAWTGRQAPHTLGLWCDPAHPLFARFPTDAHTNWQWWYPLQRAAALILDGLPPELRPLVGVVDDHVTNRRLGLVFEARVGPGRLLVSSIDVELREDEALDPVTNQLRAALFAYAAGDAFRPAVAVDPAALRTLARPPALLERLGARIHECDSAHDDHPPEHAIDGDPATIWHTDWEPAAPLPHRLVVDLGRPQALAGVRLVPRQDLANGRIARAEIRVFDDPASRGEPVAVFAGEDRKDPRTVAFAHPARGRFVELLVTAEVGGRPFASLAELEPVLAQ
ncbi:MAG: hypothetical protein FJ265_08030 [Planctomycetes bacterium]|nr:hypothetical protein [Planctomycetota bacterium]